jgi:hypothetical protein
MSKKILSVEGGRVKEHKVRSDVERNSEELYKALSTYIGVPAEDKSPGNVIATSIGAIEYACVVGKHTGVTKDVFLESVTNVWERVTTPEGGAVREQG